jgi:hypothetical protein
VRVATKETLKSEGKIFTKKGSTLLPGSDFGAPEVEHRRRWIAEIAGPEKVGKTSWALSAPDPIVIFDIDRRLEGVIDRYLAEGKHIELISFTLPPVEQKNARHKEKFDEKEIARTIEAAVPLWNMVLRNYQLALEASLPENGSRVKTIIFDTHSELMDLRLMAEFGRTSQIPPDARGGMNAEFSELVRRAANYDANVIHISQVRDVWKNNQNTGQTEPRAWNKLGYAVQTVLLMDLIKGDPTVTVHRNGAGNGLSMNGEMYDSSDWDDYPPFAFCAAQLMGGEPEEWMTDPKERKRILRGG